MIRPGQNWKCLHCGHAQVVSTQRCHRLTTRLQIDGNADEDLTAIRTTAVVCANSFCRRLSVHFEIGEGGTTQNGTSTLRTIHKSWNLLPGLYLRDRYRTASPRQFARISLKLGPLENSVRRHLPPCRGGAFRA